jgi:hypothetical protein
MGYRLPQHGCMIKGRRAARWLAAGTALAGVSWAVCAGFAWARFGRSGAGTTRRDADELLDHFMPEFDVSIGHQLRVEAPAERTFAAASALDLRKSRLIRAIFRGRELLMRSKPVKEEAPATLFAWAESLGWRLLGEVPGCEVVFGAVTKPWEPNVVFRPLEPDRFARFHEPGYAKIVWTVRVDPTGPSQSMVRTDTRVLITDPQSRARFRRYWAVLSPGMLLIRYAALRMVKRSIFT